MEPNQTSHQAGNAILKIENLGAVDLEFLTFQILLFLILSFPFFLVLGEIIWDVIKDGDC